MRNRLRGLIARYLWTWARLVLVIRGPRIVGITGTVGKTTTAALLASALRQPEARDAVGAVGHSAENMNNDIGLPLAILGERTFPSTDLRGFRLMCALPFRALTLAFGRSYPDTLVLEFGAGITGNVPANARRARPHVAVVTAIGPAHLDTFRTVQEVARFKAGLVESVPPEGCVILGRPNPFLDLMRGRSRAPVVIVDGRGAELSAEITRSVCSRLRIPQRAAERAITEFRGVAGRQQLIEVGNVRVINDAFNANPLSMRFALERLAAEKGTARRVAILGWMDELGSETLRFHEGIAPYAAECADLIIGVGELARAYEPHRWFASSEACAAAVDEIVTPGDVVLVKGSHAVRMDLVVGALRARVTPAKGDLFGEKGLGDERSAARANTNRE